MDNFVGEDNGCKDDAVVVGVAVTCLLLTSALCTWAIRHLCSLGVDAQKKLFWVQLFALTATDLVSSLMHLTEYLFVWIERRGVNVSVNNRFFWDAMNFVDFSSCILEMQIAAGFAVACSGSVRLASLLRWTLPLGFVAAAGLAITGCFLRSVRIRPVDEGMVIGYCLPGFTLATDILWSGVALSCCALIALFCGYGVVQSRTIPGPIRRRGLIRGVSYVMTALVTWVPYAIVVNLEANQAGMWKFAKMISNYAFYLNGAVNVSGYVYWMWHSQRMQERFEVQRQLSDCESLVLDTYFDVDGSHDAETRMAMRLAAEAVSLARLAEEGLEESSCGLREGLSVGQ